MTDLECDVAIIGAGTAGLAAERSARRAGARTLLIDTHFSGTTCATVGCMPSKLLIAAANAAHAAHSASEFGVNVSEVTVDGPAVLLRLRTLRNAFVASTLKSIEDLAPETKLKGTARFINASTLDVDGRKVKARAIVIATGSRPAIPKTFEALPNVLTNETVFELKKLPASLAVIGSGPLGLELAQAFARLGVDVAVFDETDGIGGLHDAAVADCYRRLLEREMPLHRSVTVTAEAVGEAISLSWSGKSTGKRRFSHVLVATGRPPSLSGLDLEATGLALDDHGTPLFERTTMQCGTSAIFLAGDADADVPVLHEASAEGAIAGRNAAHYPDIRPSRRSTSLAITFTDPSSATIGFPPEQDTVIGEAGYGDQGRAKVENRNCGLIRLYARPDGRLTGATLAVPQAEHLAHLLTWAIEDGLTAMDVLERPFYHPTLEEGMRNALRQICSKTDLSFAADRDQGTVPGV